MYRRHKVHAWSGTGSVRFIESRWWHQRRRKEGREEEEEEGTTAGAFDDIFFSSPPPLAVVSSLLSSPESFSPSASVLFSLNALTLTHPTTQPPTLEWNMLVVLWYRKRRSNFCGEWKNARRLRQNIFFPRTLPSGKWWWKGTKILTMLSNVALLFIS